MKRDDKTKKEELLLKIKRAGSEKYLTEWSKEGKIGAQKEITEVKKGRKSKLSGSQFELRVRKDLEEKGWVVDKWSNNIDLEMGGIHSAKRKYNPFSKAMVIGTGFPDFIAFQKMGEFYKVVGIEVKINGTLSLKEKKKCRFYLDKKIFNEILIAKKKKEKNRIYVEYSPFEEIEKRMRV